MVPNIRLCQQFLLLQVRVVTVWLMLDSHAGRYKSDAYSKESSWCNPLLNPLPKAPSMSIYCFGSRDRPTEIAYLMRDQGQSEQACSDKWSRPISTITQMASGHQLLETTNGDGTIPWLSQTLMCSDREVHGVRGWKGNSDLNPGEVQVRNVVVALLCGLPTTFVRRKYWSWNPSLRRRATVFTSGFGGRIATLAM
jgi:hypothetical protein